MEIKEYRIVAKKVAYLSQAYLKVCRRFFFYFLLFGLSFVRNSTLFFIYSILFYLECLKRFYCIVQKYPAYNVRLRPGPVNQNVKFLPFKNGDPATSPEILKPEVTVSVAFYPQFESEISILLQQYLDPKGACRYDTVSL